MYCRCHLQFTTPNTTITTTAEIKTGINFCTIVDDSPTSYNRFELNVVKCDSNEICQPFTNQGPYANLGYVYFSNSILF